MSKLAIFLVSSILMIVPCFAQDSNPDGLIGKPSLTIMGGIQKGSGEVKIFEPPAPISYKDDLDGYGGQALLIYPASRTVSLLFEIDIAFQKLKSPQTIDFWRQESDINSYSFVIGLRLFTQ